MTKKHQNFFLVWNMGCQIEWAHGGDNFLFRKISELIGSTCFLVEQGRESLVSLVTAHSKYCFLPKGKKLVPFAPMSRLPASLKPQKMRRPFRAPRKRVSILQTLFFFLISRTFGFDYFLFHPLLNFIHNLFPIL